MLLSHNTMRKPDVISCPNTNVDFKLTLHYIIYATMSAFMFRIASPPFVSLFVILTFGSYEVRLEISQQRV